MTDDDNALADLGVLLVHGIGQSHSGDTLSRFGEPLVDWIVDWVGGAGDAEVEVMDAVLGVEAEDPDMPAHSWLQVSGPNQEGSGTRATRWLVAESWWAESFLTPSFGDIAKWGCQVVPWTAFYHFHRRLLRAGSRFKQAKEARPRKPGQLIASSFQVGFEFATLLAALLLAPIAVTILLLLLALGLLPIPSLRRLVARIQRGLALTIGDSYALLGPKIGSAAIYGRVARELRWMEQRARKVAVVAHSQGAAVAYRVVSRDRSGQCGLLITFGAGLRKLTQIRLLDELGGSWAVWNSLAVLFLILAAMISRETLGLLNAVVLTAVLPLGWALSGAIATPIAALLRKITGRVPGENLATDKRQTIVGLCVIIITIAAIAIWSPGESRATAVWVALLVSFAWGWLATAYLQAGEAARSIAVMDIPESGRASPATESPLPASVRWIDLYAASDPVSNGPIFDDQGIDPITFRGEAPGLESCLVYNRNSLLMDHTTYWQNAEEFVAETVTALGRESGLNLSEVRPMDEERLIVARHRRHWRVRWLHRASLMVIAGVLSVWVWGDFDRYTTALFDGLISLVKAVPWLGTLLANVLPENATATATSTTITLLLGLFAALGLVNAGWSLLDARDRACLVERRPYPLPKSGGLHPALLFHFAWMACVAVCAGLVFGWLSWPWWSYLGTFTLLFLAAGGVAGGADTFAFAGDVRDSWPALLRRHGRWNEQAHQHWQDKVVAGTTALIDLVRTDEGTLKWQSRLCTGIPGRASAQAPGYRVYQADSLFIAAAWSRTRSGRQCATMDGDHYVETDALLLGQGDTRHVVGFWSRVIDHPEVSPAQRAEALLNRAHHWAASGTSDEALADYTAVTSMAGTCPAQAATAYAEKGWMGYLAGDEQSFYKDTEQALELDPDNLPIGFNMAFAALVNGKLDETRELYRKYAAQCQEADALKAAISDIQAMESQPHLEEEKNGNLEVLEARLNELSTATAV